MLFFTPDGKFFLERLSDRSRVWFRPEYIYCESSLEFFDLSSVCPGMTLGQRVKHLSKEGYVTIIELKDIKDLIKCLLFNESAK